MSEKTERDVRYPRVAVVGAGRWGRNHVRVYGELGALAGIVDLDAEAARAAAAPWGAPVLTFAEALASPGIDALVFALPPSRNLPLGRRALEAGKHLFVEKPLAMTVADGEELCGIAAARDRRLMVGHILRYHPAFGALLGLAVAGRLGRLLSVVSTRLDLGRVRREEDALWALAPHDVSMILALAGTEPERVSASGGFHTHPAIADTASVALGFPGGLAADIRVSWLHPFKEQKLVVVGTDAMAVFDDREPWDSKLSVQPWSLAGQDDAPRAERGEPYRIPVEPGEPLRAECLHFLHCVASGERPLTDGEEGLRVLQVLERSGAALASRRNPVVRDG